MMDQVLGGPLAVETDLVVGCGDLRIDLRTKAVTVGSEGVHLTDHEYRTLELLVILKATVTNSFLVRHLYGEKSGPDGIAKVLICGVRKKLADASNGKNYIRTFWGKGYTIIDPDATHTNQH